MDRLAGPWTREAKRLLPAMRAWRSSFHQEPELAYHETRTRQKVVDALGSLGIESRTFPGLTAVVGLVGKDRRGPVVALRSDMDALPVSEETGLAEASRFEGRMHACGHDVHLGSLLGAAAMLKKHESRLGGPVKLLFQPAEEEGRRGGALPLLERGVFERPKVSFVVGQHVAPEIPLGYVGWRSGPLMAAADHFVVTVRGTGGHAAYPHRGPDAIVVSAEVITGMQSLVSRVRDPLDPVVVSVGMVHGGTRHNVLPDEVVMEGTVRTFRPDTRAAFERLIRRRVRHIAASLGATAKVEYRPGYPVTVNDPGATRTVVRALSTEFGRDHLVEIDRPVMGAEDFSRYLERVPGTFLFLGVGEGPTPPSLHSARFAPSDSALVTGAAALAAAAEGLQEPGP